MSFVTTLKPNKGIIQWSNQRALFDYLLQNDGKELYAKFDKVKSVRSLDQNSYYHAFLDIIEKETGQNHDELHRIFKGLFLPKKKVILKGKEYVLAGSTTELSKTEMGEYMDKISALVEIALPDPKLLAMDKAPAYPENNLGETPF
jgi:hypothetical protein